LSIVYLVAAFLLAMLGIWIVSALFELVLFKRVIRHRMWANIASTLAAWITLSALSIGKDPLLLAGYTVAAVILIVLAYVAGPNMDREAKDKAADIFE